MKDYRAPAWLAGRGAVGGNLQTIWPALFSRRFHGPAPLFRRERWTTPDQDFIDVDWGVNEASVPLEKAAADAASGLPTRPLLVLFHGLEGSSGSHYAQAFGCWARDNGWDYAVPHFRGCSGEINLAPRAYHAGDFEEIGWVLQGMRNRRTGPIAAVGVSLGGNALLRWAEEAGDSAARIANAVCAVSSPIDLAAGGEAIRRGFNQQVYSRMFLRTMVPKALRKLAQHPGLFDANELKAVRDIYGFDNVFTAPVHGFRNADDYWKRGSAKPHLKQIRVPTLVLNAHNDPFVPSRSLPRQPEVGPWVTLWQPEHGGHVGFARGRWPGHVMTLPEQLMAWVGKHAGGA